MRVFVKKAAAVMAAMLICSPVTMPLRMSFFTAAPLTAGAAVSASLDQSSGILTLSGSVDKSDVVYYSGSKNVKRVVASEDAVLPADCSYMFQGFNASEIDIAAADTSKVVNTAGMFRQCTALTSLKTDFSAAKGITDMNGMFYGCSALKELDVSSFDTFAVRDMSSMFENCSVLRTIDLSGFAVSSGCNTADIFKRSAVPHIKLAGAGLTLTSERIGIKMTFYNNSFAEKVVLDGPHGAEVTETETMFPDKEDGTYMVMYFVNAAQAGESIRLSFVNSDGSKCAVLNSDGRLIGSGFEYSVNDYISSADSFMSQNSNEKKLVTALDNYCKATENYFCGTHHETAGIADVSEADTSAYKMTDSGLGCRISLVLESRPVIRIYYSGTADTAVYNKKTLNAMESRYGKYFELSTISLSKPYDMYTMTIDGKTVSFNAFSYVDRVLGNSSADSRLKDVCKALYVYMTAAKNYAG